MVALVGREALVCSRTCRKVRPTKAVKRTSDQLLQQCPKCRPARPCSALQSAFAQTISLRDKLLDWLHQQDPVAEAQALEVDVTASTAGRCLRVKFDTAPDTLLLSVPMSIVFEDDQVCPEVHTARHNSCTHCPASDETRQAAEG